MIKHEYIVTGEYGALVLCEEPGEKETVLLHGHTATVFVDRRSAKRAIARTRVYASKRGYSWSKHYRIYRLARTS